MSVPDQSTAVAAARAAATERVQWLSSLMSGYIKVSDVFSEVQSNREGPLRRLRLREVLRAGGIGLPEVSRVLKHVVEVTRGNPETNFAKVTISWLIDSKSGGRRAAVLEDSFAPRVAPWPGYPLAPEPTQ